MVAYRKAIVDSLVISSVYSLAITILMGSVDVSAWVLNKRSPDLRNLFYGNIFVVAAVITAHTLSVEEDDEQAVELSASFPPVSEPLAPTQNQIRSRLIEEFVTSEPGSIDKENLLEAVQVLTGQVAGSSVFHERVVDSSTTAPNYRPPPPPPSSISRSPGTESPARISDPQDVFAEIPSPFDEVNEPEELRDEFFDQTILANLSWSNK